MYKSNDDSTSPSVESSSDNDTDGFPRPLSSSPQYDVAVDVKSSPVGSAHGDHGTANGIGIDSLPQNKGEASSRSGECCTPEPDSNNGSQVRRKRNSTGVLGVEDHMHLFSPSPTVARVAETLGGIKASSSSTRPAASFSPVKSGGSPSQDGWISQPRQAPAKSMGGGSHSLTPNGGSRRRGLGQRSVSDRFLDVETSQTSRSTFRSIEESGKRSPPPALAVTEGVSLTSKTKKLQAFVSPKSTPSPSLSPRALNSAPTSIGGLDTRPSSPVPNGGAAKTTPRRQFTRCVSLRALPFMSPEATKPTLNWLKDAAELGKSPSPFAADDESQHKKSLLRAKYPPLSSGTRNIPCRSPPQSSSASDGVKDTLMQRTPKRSLPNDGKFVYSPRHPRSEETGPNKISPKLPTPSDDTPSKTPTKSPRQTNAQGGRLPSRNVPPRSWMTKSVSARNFSGASPVSLRPSLQTIENGGLAKSPSPLNMSEDVVLAENQKSQNKPCRRMMMNRSVSLRNFSKSPQPILNWMEDPADLLKIDTPLESEYRKLGRSPLPPTVSEDDVVPENLQTQNKPSRRMMNRSLSLRNFSKSPQSKLNWMEDPADLLTASPSLDTDRRKLGKSPLPPTVTEDDAISDDEELQNKLCRRRMMNRSVSLRNFSRSPQLKMNWMEDPAALLKISPPLVSQTEQQAQNQLLQHSQTVRNEMAELDASKLSEVRKSWQDKIRMSTQSSESLRSSQTKDRSLNQQSSSMQLDSQSSSNCSSRRTSASFQGSGRSLTSFQEEIAAKNAEENDEIFNNSSSSSLQYNDQAESAKNKSKSSLGNDDSNRSLTGKSPSTSNRDDNGIVASFSFNSPVSVTSRTSTSNSPTSTSTSNSNSKGGARRKKSTRLAYANGHVSKDKDLPSGVTTGKLLPKPVISSVDITKLKGTESTALHKKLSGQSKDDMDNIGRIIEPFADEARPDSSHLQQWPPQDNSQLPTRRHSCEGTRRLRWTSDNMFLAGDKQSEIKGDDDDDNIEEHPSPSTKALHDLDREFFKSHGEVQYERPGGIMTSPGAHKKSWTVKPKQANATISTSGEVVENRMAGDQVGHENEAKVKKKDRKKKHSKDRAANQFSPPPEIDPMVLSIEAKEREAKDLPSFKDVLIDIAKSGLDDRAKRAGYVLKNMKAQGICADETTRKILEKCSWTEDVGHSPPLRPPIVNLASVQPLPKVLTPKPPPALVDRSVFQLTTPTNTVKKRVRFSNVNETRFIQRRRSISAAYEHLDDPLTPPRRITEAKDLVSARFSSGLRDNLPSMPRRSESQSSLMSANSSISGGSATTDSALSLTDSSSSGESSVATFDDSPPPASPRKTSIPDTLRLPFGDSSPRHKAKEFAEIPKASIHTPLSMEFGQGGAGGSNGTIPDAPPSDVCFSPPQRRPSIHRRNSISSVERRRAPLTPPRKSSAPFQIMVVRPYAGKRPQTPVPKPKSSRAIRKSLLLVNPPSSVVVGAESTAETCKSSTKIAFDDAKAVAEEFEKESTSMESYLRHKATMTNPDSLDNLKTNNITENVSEGRAESSRKRRSLLKKSESTDIQKKTIAKEVLGIRKQKQGKTQMETNPKHEVAADSGGAIEAQNCGSKPSMTASEPTNENTEQSSDSKPPLKSSEPISEDTEQSCDSKPSLNASEPISENTEQSCDSKPSLKAADLISEKAEDNLKSDPDYSAENVHRPIARVDEDPYYGYKPEAWQSIPIKGEFNLTSPIGRSSTTERRSRRYLPGSTGGYFNPLAEEGNGDGHVALTRLEDLRVSESSTVGSPFVGVGMGPTIRKKGGS